MSTAAASRSRPAQARRSRFGMASSLSPKIPSPVIGGRRTGLTSGAPACASWMRPCRRATGQAADYWMECPPAKKPQAVEYLAARRTVACREYLVSIKEPLTTPVAAASRRQRRLAQMLDLYVCLRPVRWFKAYLREASGEGRHGHLPEIRRHLRRHRVRSGTEEPEVLDLQKETSPKSYAEDPFRNFGYPASSRSPRKALTAHRRLQYRGGEQAKS